MSVMNKSPIVTGIPLCLPPFYGIIPWVPEDFFSVVCGEIERRSRHLTQGNSDVQLHNIKSEKRLVTVSYKRQLSGRHCRLPH